MAARDLNVGDIVLEDTPLIHIQKCESKVLNGDCDSDLSKLDALVCSHCMRFVGSLEEQVQITAW